MKTFQTIILLTLFTISAYANSIDKTYKVVVLTEWNPYYILDNNGKPSGYAIELFEKVALNLNLKYEYVIVNKWSEAMKLLEENKVDLIPNMGKTLARAKYVDYSQVTDLFEIVLYKHNTHKNITNIKDLQNLKVGVLKKNVCEKLINPAITNNKVVFDTLPSALSALNDRNIDMLCSPKNIIEHPRDEIDNEDIENFGKPLKIVHRAFGVTKENSDLLTLIDYELIQLKANGEYQKIYNKWFLKHKDIEIDYDELVEIIVLILLILFVLLYILKEKRLLITKKELKEKTKEIEKEKKLYDFYLNNMNIVFVVLDKYGKIQMINKFAVELLGLNKKTIIGKNWFDIGVLPSDELDMVREYFDNAMSGKVILPRDVFENELLDNNGNRLVFQWSNSLLIEKGKIEGVISSGVDITNEKKQKDIIDQQTRLASMGEMIGNIAHQWRQPLSIISTAASGVKVKKELDVLDDSELISYMDNIVFQSGYLSETIDTFRDFIKEDKEKKPCAIQDVIDDALKIVKPSLMNNHIELKNQIDVIEPIRMELVSGELTQVIVNILNNSKDAFKDHNIKDPLIEVDLQVDEQNVLLSFKDNAGGIPKHVMPNIFEPYFTTKHSSVGTGLGLHMCYKIITESLNGEIYAQNTNNGVKFEIKLPITNQISSKD